MDLLPRPRPFPDTTLPTTTALVAFLEFLSLTAVNKLTGLDEEQARATPVPSSPVVSVLGLVKHLTAVQRQHVQIHIGGADLPSLWRADDHDFEFRIGSDETIQSVVSAFDDERRRTQATLREIDVDRPITVYGRLNTVGRLLVDVVQETARHVGHIDIVRELVDGATGE